ncbi:hypothetical protein [Pseudarthrobacter sp. S6]|uniref:hypothetical protein n=1 Tax=Pseudarthrobacter sp. S6 TaxID=3418420 RepID=UPI003CE6D29C
MSLVDMLGASAGEFEVSGGFADVYPNIRHRGLVQPATWLCDYAAPGESIIVGTIGKPDAPAQMLVLGRVGAPGPTEATVTAAPGGSDTITVTAAGVDYTATFLTSYAPTVSDRVRLFWQGGSGTVLGKVGITPTTAPAPPSTAPPPPASSSGTLPVAAIDSATYSGSLYGWNAYYGNSVYQGDGSTWGAPSANSGAWFYGNGAGQLAGATVTGVQFRIPARRSGGASGSAATVHLWLHTNPSRPGGDVSRTTGPIDVSIPAGYGGGWVDLPAGWGAALITGGGIGITGSPYMGLVGRDADPASGQINLTWQR